MKKNMIKKSIATMLAITTLLSSAVTTNASTCNTIYGAMTYTLTKPETKAVHACTSITCGSKSFSYIRTALEIQYNSTGQTVGQSSSIEKYKKGYTISTNCMVRILDSTTTYAAFSCHEIVGTTAYAKYKCTTF